MHPASDENIGHEASNVSIRALLRFAIIFVIAAVVIHVIVWWLYRGYVKREARADTPVTGLSSARTVPPGPRLQPAWPDHPALPVQDMALLTKRENEAFRRRGWVDASNGAIRIPDEIVDRVIASSRRPITTSTGPATREGRPE